MESKNSSKMVLWQKKNGIYSDICMDPEHGPGAVEDMYEIMRDEYGWMKPKEKCNKTSNSKRKSGNSYFKSDDWYDAIQFYNRSLMFAENNSENVGLAYANRSACFFHLKMYDKCLVDIELAIEAGYPAKLMPKLENRKKECIDLMEKYGSVSRPVPELDYESNEKLPGMANVLQIERDDEFGRMVTAKCDIPAGKIVLVEKALMKLYMEEKQKKCATCLKSHTNLVPCKQCTFALFCKGECEKSFLHKMECGLRSVNEEIPNNHQMDIFRSVLIAIDIFSSVDELMEFVEQTVSGEYMSKIPDELRDIRSQYATFLQLWYSEKVSNGPTFHSQTYFVYRMLLNQESIREMFSTLEHQRFLMNLVGHHLCLIQCNSGGIIYDMIDDRFGRDFNEARVIVANYINHSCAPNTNIISYEDLRLCITIRPIKKGEQLFLSYFRNDRFRKSYENKYRQKHLKIMYQFDCECEQCSLEFASELDRDTMKKDELFRCICKINKEPKYYDEHQTEILMDICVEFLNKYGHLKWNDEIEATGEKYIALLGHKYRNEPNCNVHIGE